MKKVMFGLLIMAFLSGCKSAPTVTAIPIVETAPLSTVTVIDENSTSTRTPTNTLVPRPPTATIRPFPTNTNIPSEPSATITLDPERDEIQTLVLYKLRGLVLTYESTLWRETNDENRNMGLLSLIYPGCRIREQGGTEPPFYDEIAYAGSFVFDVASWDNDEGIHTVWFGTRTEMEGYDGDTPTFVLQSPIETRAACVSYAKDVLATLSLAP